MNIYLIRHARQSSGLCNVNVDLAPEGIEQAQLLAKRFKDVSLDALYSSHLIRAVQTAQYINEYHGLEHNIREDLMEIDFGDMTGLTQAQIAQTYGDFLIENKKLKEDLPYPCGENGEDAFQRANKVLLEIVTSGKKDVAVVTHGGIIRSLMAGLFCEDMTYKALFGHSLENTSITHLIYEEKEDRFYIQRFNDYAHLEVKPNLLKIHWNKQ